MDKWWFRIPFVVLVAIWFLPKEIDPMLVFIIAMGGFGFITMIGMKWKFVSVRKEHEEQEFQEHIINKDW